MNIISVVFSGGPLNGKTIMLNAAEVEYRVNTATLPEASILEELGPSDLFMPEVQTARYIQTLHRDKSKNTIYEFIGYKEK